MAETELIGTPYPLHVRVAEALGWTEFYDRGGLWLGVPPPPSPHKVIEVPRYDVTWCSTGVLIDRFRILIGPEHTRNEQHEPLPLWSAMLASQRVDATIVKGPTAVQAVCNLIVQLHKEGKLPNA